MITNILPKSLKQMNTFSRQEYVKAMSGTYRMTDEQIAYDLRKRLKSGEIIRQGWGQYREASAKHLYHYEYSELSNTIADIMEEAFVDLDFRIFESVQLNNFMNHLIGRNTIFLYVENEFTDYAFEKLFELYPGKVMLKPRINDFYRYFQSDTIVINRLPTESPKGLNVNWHIRLEQILVDVLVDKFMSEFIPESEKENIVEGAFDAYLVDEKTMIRYAKRKGAEKKLAAELKKYRKEIAI